jgi:ABC-type polysaccharide/polyol phosphate transport system ATPase subunit
MQDGRISVTGAGFHPELTGAENVLMNGLIIGLSKQEVNAKFDKIADFADIGKFMYAPFYTYSEGMKLRLGFSIAFNADPDIFLLDEGSAAGDDDFRKKVKKAYSFLIKKQKTMISVSHWNVFLKEMLQVNRVVLMQDGRISVTGGVGLLVDKL